MSDHFDEEEESTWQDRRASTKDDEERRWEERKASTKDDEETGPKDVVDKEEAITNEELLTKSEVTIEKKDTKKSSRRY